MKRFLFNMLAGLSLLLCAGTIAMWLNSYYALGIGSKEGTLLICVIEKNDDGRDYMQRAFGVAKMDEVDVYHDLLAALKNKPLPNRRGKSVLKNAWGPHARFGLEISACDTYSYNLSIDPRLNFKYVLVSIPYWIAFLFPVALSIFFLIGARRLNRRGQLSLCEKCGYDIRATPDQCPECGDVPKTARKKSTATDLHSSVG